MQTIDSYTSQGKPQTLKNNAVTKELHLTGEARNRNKKKYKPNEVTPYKGAPKTMTRNQATES